jgi:MoaA/NifB/PqqE/SkfB family radical SAM enzyme
MKQYIEENMDNIVVSLDGRQHVHDAIRKTAGGGGSYERVVKNAKELLLKRKGEYYVRGTYTSDNLDFSSDVLHVADMGFKGAGYVISFTIIYLLWDFIYGANDIAYWSMLPSLTIDQKEREKTGSFARICANVGMYMVVVGILPITNAIGGDKKAWFIFAVGVIIITWTFLSFTLLGVKEDQGQIEETYGKDEISYG